MKSLVSRILVTAVLLTTAQVAANPNVVNVKGTQTILKPEYQQLGLAHGCVWWKLPICENLYRIAYEKDKMAEELKKGTLKLSAEQQEAFVRTPVDDLVQELFHLHNDLINFIPTVEPKKLGSYLTPEAVGQVVGLLYQLEQKGEVWAGMCQKLIEEVITTLMPNQTAIAWRRLLELEPQIKTIMTQEAVANAAFEKYKKVRDKEGQHKTLVVLKSLRAAKQKLLEERTKLPTNMPAVSVAKTIVAAYMLCQKENSVYLPETVYCLLLAHVWGKANTRAELQSYYDGLMRQLGEAIFVPDIDRIAWLQEAFTFVEAEEACKRVSIAMPFEKLVLATFAQQDVMSVVPPFISFSTARYQGISFSDCGEIALLNILRLLCWHAEDRTFDSMVFEKMKKAKPDYADNIDHIITFFKALEGYDPAVDTGELHDRWAAIVSELPGVAYAHPKSGTYKICEISAPGTSEGSFNNFEKVIQALTGCTGLEELATYAKQPLKFAMAEIDKQESVWKVPFEYKGMRLDDSEVVVSGSVDFLPGHFELRLEQSVATIATAVLPSIEGEEFGSLACVIRLYFANSYGTITSLQKLPDARLRRYCCLLGRLRDSIGRDFGFKVLDDKDPWYFLILRAAYRVVPDDYYAQVDFFRDFSAAMLSSFINMAKSSTQKSGIIVAILGLDSVAQSEFKGWIDGALQDISDDRAKGSMISTMLEKKVYHEFKSWIDTTLPTIQSNEERSFIIVQILRNGLCDQFETWINKTIPEMVDDEDKSYIAATMVETGLHKRIGTWQAWIDTAIADIQDENAKRDVLYSILKDNDLSERYKGFIDTNLGTMRDDYPRFSSIEGMLATGIYKKFPEWKTWVDTTLPKIQSEDLKTKLITMMLEKNVQEDFKDLINTVLTSIQEDDYLKRDVINKILDKDAQKDFKDGISAVLSAIKRDNFKIDIIKWLLEKDQTGEFFGVINKELDTMDQDSYDVHTLRQRAFFNAKSEAKKLHQKPTQTWWEWLKYGLAGVGF